MLPSIYGGPQEARGFAGVKTNMMPGRCKGRSQQSPWSALGYSWI